MKKDMHSAGLAAGGNDTTAASPERQAHTPGPWRAIDSGDDIWCVTTSDGQQIAPVFDPIDANLIAASPTLLSACRAVANWDCLINDGLPGHIADELYAAIAKAEGR